MALIALRHIEKRYRTGRFEVPAVRGISLEVERGEFISIMGPSGSGKSTLLNLIGCLDRPTAGAYYLDGRDVATLSEGVLADVRNAVLGFIFQSFNLLPRLTALQNVELPLIYRGVPGAERRRRAAAALEAVGLGPRLHHRPGELSGGEQQRVAVARAVVGDPLVILADEPTGNLDTRSGEELMALLQAENARRKTTIVQVTHDPDIARHSSRIVYLRDGLVVGAEAVPEPLRAEAVLAELPPARGAHAS